MRTFLLLFASAASLSGAFNSCVAITQYAPQVATSGTYTDGVDFNLTDTRLNTVVNGGLVTNANGYDIVFSSDPLGANLLKWDALDTYSGNTGVVATHIALTLSATTNTVFYMCVGNPAVTTFQGGTGVWSTSAVGIYHMSNSNAQSTVSGADSSTYGNNSSAYSTAMLNNIGHYGGGGFTTGGTAAIAVPDSTSLNPSSVSYSAWVWINGSISQTNSIILDKGYVSGPAGGRYLILTDSCQVSFADSTYLNVAMTIPRNTWLQISCTYNSVSGVLTGYLNGVAAGTATATGSRVLLTSTGPLAIGAGDAAGTGGFAGNLDEVRIWNGVRTPAQIQTEYNNGLITNSYTPYSFLSLGIWSNTGVYLETGNFPYWYNDQNGANGRSNYWPSTTRATEGDTGYSTWDSAGNIFLTFADGTGYGQNGLTSGCLINSFGNNVGLATINANLTLATNVNCFSSMGGAGGTNTGGWTDGWVWKNSGLIAINDGRTKPGIYLSVHRQFDDIGAGIYTSPFPLGSDTIMYSPDAGVTWCAPGHTIVAGTCNTNGDAPAPNTYEFQSPFLDVQYIQYEQGGTGAMAVDCQNNYIYAYGSTTDFTRYILGRVARGTDLQVAANWTYYTGAVGGNVCTSGSWGSVATSGTVLYSLPVPSFSQPTTNFMPAIVYIPGWGYLMTINNGIDTLIFNRAPSPSGPWSTVYTEPGTFTYSFYSPMLHTLKTMTNPAGWSIEILCSGYYQSAGANTASNQTTYSHFYRTLTIANLPSSIKGGSAQSGGKATGH